MKLLLDFLGPDMEAGIGRNDRCSVGPIIYINVEPKSYACLNCVSHIESPTLSNIQNIRYVTFNTID